ncbi:alpha/beta fold hydrolase [Actinomadura hibisca]|uniref:alpha/beta fold hydrolase n=1 Tax=Actinomadura hibisca TaxID=68565 RepID=UPI000830FFBB|nr:alpha/beta hydrolase [Actinomadura hibisca]
MGSLASEDRNAPPLGSRHQVRDRRLMLHRSGSGGPAVVFLAGAGQVGLDYLTVHDRVAELTCSVLYDRGGTGWSDHVELPRTAADVTDELRDLLRVAQIDAPYILVGHSLGGAYARHYAQRFPDDVAGLLLLDPFHEDLYELGPQQARDQLAQMHRQPIPELTPEQEQQARVQIAPMFDAWPENVRQPLIDHHVTAAWKAGLLEDRNLYDQVAAELRQGPELPDVPLIVLTALGHDDTQAHLWADQTLRQINDLKTKLHARLAASVPRGQHRLLDAGHGWLHQEHPDAVLQAVRDLLDASGARRRGTGGWW